MKKFIGFDFLNSILVFIGVFGKDILFLTRINHRLLWVSNYSPQAVFIKSGTIEELRAVS